MPYYLLRILRPCWSSPLSSPHKWATCFPIRSSQCLGHISLTLIIRAVITRHAWPLDWLRELPGGGPVLEWGIFGVRGRHYCFQPSLQHLRWVLQLTGGGAEFHTLALLAPSLGPLITMLYLMLQHFGISRVHSLTQNNEQGIWPAKREKELQEDAQVPPPRCLNIWAEYKMDSAVRTKGLARWGQALPGNPGRGTKSQRFQKPGAESIPSSGNTP